LEKDLKNKV